MFFSIHVIFFKIFTLELTTTVMKLMDNVSQYLNALFAVRFLHNGRLPLNKPKLDGFLPRSDCDLRIIF